MKTTNLVKKGSKSLPFIAKLKTTIENPYVLLIRFVYKILENEPPHAPRISSKYNPEGDLGCQY